MPVSILLVYGLANEFTTSIMNSFVCPMRAIEPYQNLISNLVSDVIG